MTETAKERIYREALDEINNLAIDVAMDFEETGIDSVDCGKIMDIAYKAFFAETNRQPVTTDEKTVEKLQERCDRYEQVLTEISKTKVPFRNGCFHWEDFSEDSLKAQHVLKEFV